MEINVLNQNFGIKNQVEFFNLNDTFAAVRITNNSAISEISLYGAHVMSFVPKGQKDILWMSPNCIYQEGTPLRGGIPICLPWFSAHPTDTTKPMHGFVRLNTWNVLETKAIDDNTTCIKLGIKSNENTKKLWNEDFETELLVMVGKKLEVKLTYINLSKNDVTISCALHSYFSIGNNDTTCIEGLLETDYLDNLENQKQKKQTEKLLNIDKEINRRYINTTNDCLIHDKELGRIVRVAKQNSNASVVWNPFSETIKTMKDLPHEGYKSFVCIEAANINTDARTLKPNEKHELTTILSLD